MADLQQSARSHGPPRSYVVVTPAPPLSLLHRRRPVSIRARTLHLPREASKVVLGRRLVRPLFARRDLRAGRGLLQMRRAG